MRTDIPGVPGPFPVAPALRTPPAPGPDGPARAPDGAAAPVRERMEPLPSVLPAFATAESARRRLEREALRFLLVVAPGTGRLVGAVDAEALAPRPCCARLGGRCAVVQHLAPRVGFCFAHESTGEVEEGEAELAAAARPPAPRRIPLVVVDPELRPLGIFRPGSATAEAPRDATPHAA